MKAFGGFSASAVCALFLVCLHSFANGSDNSIGGGSGTTDEGDPIVTQLAYFDISIGGKYVGRMEFGLFGDLCPKTVLNFVTLCKGNIRNNNDVLLTYKRCTWHRVIKGFMGQGGDFTQGNGYGGESIYGTYFNDENFTVKHYGIGWIGMANAGNNTNGSQFYVPFALTKWLDGGHTIFGVIVNGSAGLAVLRAIENNPTDNRDRPIAAVVIEECGTLPLSYPFSVPRAPVQ